MPDQPAAEKTELPTPRRLQKARQQGQVAQSVELASAGALIALVLALAASAPQLWGYFIAKLNLCLGHEQTAIFADSQAFMSFVRAGITEFFLVISPLLAAVVVGSILAGFAVSGIHFTPGAIHLKWNAINPAAVLQGALSSRSLVQLLAAIAKLLLVGLIAWSYLRTRLDTFAALRWAWSAQIIAATGQLVFGLSIRIILALLVLGIADAFYQKWHYIQQLKMTRQEVKQELRDTEGSPEVRSRIRRVQVALSMRRLRQEVPKANVILVNPTHVAVALRYESQTMEAPVLLAKGADLMAERIMFIGRSYGVPIVRRPELARTIYATVKPGQAIPQNLYVAVAEVLAMIYRLRQKKRLVSR